MFSFQEILFSDYFTSLKSLFVKYYEHLFNYTQSWYYLQVFSPFLSKLYQS